MSKSNGLPVLLSGIVCILGTVTRADDPTYFVDSTVKRWQLTGDWDAPRRIETLSRTGTRAGVLATDLGSSFEHEGKLYFLFGDTFGRPGARDVLGWTESHDPDNLVLDFGIAEDGLFKPFDVPGVDLADYEVPVGGISVGGRMYAVVTTDWDGMNMTRSVLVVSDDDGCTWDALYDLSTKHFLNVALARSNGFIYLWGSGDYRNSSPRLARVPAWGIGDPHQIRYLSGLTDGHPEWSPDEDDAMPLVDHPVVGELSAGWVESLDRWILLYNSRSPRGIILRSARRPWGPWSEPTVLFDPWVDMGYANFMHVRRDFAPLDTFNDFGREDWGGEYGPYLIGRFTEGDGDRTTIYYTMSTWNPYQVVLMSSDIGYPDRFETVDSAVTHTLPGDAGWTTTGTFVRFPRHGIPHVTTFASGAADLAVAHLGIPVDADEGEISFTLHGGDGEVVLVREESPLAGGIADIPSFYDELKSGVHGRVVEAIAGPESNEVDVAVRWNLRRHAGTNLRLFVIDHLAGSWGFLSVSQFTIEKRDVERILPPFLRGDCNDDGVVNLRDAVTLLALALSAGGSTECLAACDVNGDGVVIGSPADFLLLIQFLLSGSPPPVAPFPLCGAATLPSDTVLGCGAADACSGSV